MQKELKKILIVEDHAETRQRLSEILRQMPEVVVAGTAANGVSAIEMAEKIKPDAILLDIVMPQMDGFGVLEYFAEHGIQTDVIVVSALAQESLIARAFRLGVRFFIAKPFEDETIRARLRDLWENESVRDHSRNEAISSVFLSIGIPAHIKGYHFLREAVNMVIDNPDSINRITKELYPGIAKKFGTSPSKVERAIRHAIEVAWTRGKIESINEIFGFRVYGRNDKPTNGEFIALIADRFILKGGRL